MCSNDNSIDNNMHHHHHGDENCSKQDIVEVCVSKCRTTACLPRYAKPGDAGMDIVAAVDVHLAPGETKLIPTGLKFAIPEGYEIQVRPRSGLSLNTPLRIPNAPGTIDSGFRDEICVIMSNSSCISDNLGSNVIPTYFVSTKGNERGNYQISAGDRIAQIVIQKVPQIKWKGVDDVAEIGFDRGGGFGSTGLK